VSLRLFTVFTVTCTVYRVTSCSTRIVVISCGMTRLVLSQNDLRVYPVYTIKQQAITEQTSSKCSTCAPIAYVCFTFARCLFDDCSTFAWCLLHVGYALCTVHFCLMLAWCSLHVCFTFAWLLLDVCLMFAWWLLDRVNDRANIAQI